MKHSSTIHKAVAILKILSSKTRFQILGILIDHKNKDICVKEIAEKLKMTHSATSHQLSKLEDKGIVSCCRNGKNMCYQLNKNKTTQHLEHIINQLS